MMDRRAFLQAGSAAALAAAWGGGCATAPGTSAAPVLGFTAVPVNRDDRITLAPEYEYQLLYPWGASTGIAGALPAFRPDASNSAADQAVQAGMHHDGMHAFPIGGRGDRLLLVLNHEYTDERLLHPRGVQAGAWTAEQVAKSQHAVGVSVIELRRGAKGRWQQALPSPYARRIHAATPMRIAGPAAGHPLLCTGADPTGTRVLGTFANCAMGATPWGTYLTCEENFNGHFGSVPDAFLPTAAQRRYGIAPAAQWVDWWAHDARFDIAREPNESNRFGWVVEIDPFDPTSTPVKRTALGRKFQEGATCTRSADGRAVVYMGDDGRFEHIYKFVSARPIRDGGARANADTLDSGTLYAARFDADGGGAWLPLHTAPGFASAAEVLVHARLAASALGATPMDRPEWIVVHPHTGEVFCTLTNNTRRGTPGHPGLDAVHPRAADGVGSIVRWQEAGGDAAATAFRWQHLALAGNPADAGHAPRYPSTDADAFAAPDALHVDAGGLLWIGTDQAGQSVARNGLGHNALLCCDPASGRIRRFLTGPAGSELTGCTVAPDRRTLFVNVQHPGEARDDAAGAPISDWPDGGGARPRSATLAIRRRDGGIVGT